MKKLILLLLLMPFIFASCSSESNPEKDRQRREKAADIRLKRQKENTAIKNQKALDDYKARERDR